MPTHLRQRPVIALTLTVCTTLISAQAAEVGQPDKPNVEQAASGTRTVDGAVGGATKKAELPVKILGLTLTNPTPELMRQHGHATDFPGPIITQIQNSSFFRKGTEPTVGCSIWIVEHPAKGFGLNQTDAPSFRPQTTKEFAAAISACAISPAEYAALFEAKKHQAREQAIKQKDDPAQQSRLQAIAAATLPAGQNDKYICRLVYNYPEQKGTMTTEIYLTKAELDEIRLLTGK